MDKNLDYKKDLASKLEELKKIEGFPIGTDEDILALSEPPYYTACPNPYIKDFIEEHGKPYNEETDDYHREPFVGDVSEGKNDPIYNAHSYHTKVPHKAIMKYIEHYTDEGDIVLDGFCGTGMTGVAAQLLNRKAILSDLSPIATFIAYNYNTPVDVLEFKREAKRILDEVEKECGWMYETIHYINGKQSQTKGKINYTIWSDVFTCSFCDSEYVFWHESLSSDKQSVKKKYTCPNCGAEIDKALSNRVFKSHFDNTIKKELELGKQVPVLINYTFKGKRFFKEPDEFDFVLIDKIHNIENPYWFPLTKMPAGYNTAQPLKSHGFEYLHNFYTKRNLYVLSFLKSRIKNNFLDFGFYNTSWHGTLMRRYNPRGGHRPLTGTLYVPQLPSEANLIEVYEHKTRMLSKFIESRNINIINYLITNQSTTNFSNIDKNSIDYIFTDPPFGENIMYSELNFMWESWLKVQTNNNEEAIINSIQNKKLKEYFSLMLSSFINYYRVLKPNRWITVEFHNSKSSVWNAIQEAMSKAGFIIAQVTVLDKKQGSFKQYTSASSVKNDLVISAFKPSNSFSENFLKQAGEGLEISFINEFLSNLPKKPAIERTDKMLYSKMLAYYIQRGYEIRYDAKSFYKMLTENFVQEDGFWFTSNQIEAYLEYKKQMKLEGMDDIKSGSSLLFVNDEKSALVWLYNFLSEHKTFSDISIAFNQVANIEGDEVPELREMLEQNFIAEDGKYRRPQSETEHNSITEKRQRNLSREFETLLVQAQTQKGKIKLVRKEAMAYGFELCYKEKRFADILSIAKKLDNSILENSGELNDFVEAAEIMVEGIM